MSRHDLRGRCIMVVEDEFILAEYLSDLLTQCGAEVLGPFAGIPEALDAIETNAGRLDGAVLDLNLHGQRTYAVADRLNALNIRFVFTTGYSLDAIDPAYRHYPRCEKPLQHTALLAALTTA